jgi:hypothetical protein
VTRILAAIAVALVAVAPVAAHEKKAAGPVVLTIGWGDEPALAGIRNSVDVAVADSTGTPVAGADVTLTVQVSFGTDQTTLALAPEARQPGKFRAWIIPTRAGTYTFHVSGTVRRQPIDVTSTCSDKTFECVVDASELQFPAKDPSPGQLAEHAARIQPRADEAARRAARAEWIAIGGILLAAGALALAVVRTQAARRSTSTPAV